MWRRTHRARAILRRHGWLLAWAAAFVVGVAVGCGGTEDANVGSSRQATVSNTGYSPGSLGLGTPSSMGTSCTAYPSDLTALPLDNGGRMTNCTMYTSATPARLPTQFTSTLECTGANGTSLTCTMSINGPALTVNVSGTYNNGQRNINLTADACAAYLQRMAYICQQRDGRCPPGQTLCASQWRGNECDDLQTDNRNCGACDNMCPDISSCQAGRCVCPQNEILCNNRCVFPSSDVNNCGACGVTCPATQVCTNGACANCPNGQTACRNPGYVPACYNLQTDTYNCGACARYCSGGQTCQAGACACPAGQTTCAVTFPAGTENLCVNLQTGAVFGQIPNTQNCGRCGNACGGQQQCVNGVCQNGEN